MNKVLTPEVYAGVQAALNCGRPARILLVDDEPRNLDVIEGFLYGSGYELIRASSGEEALNCIAEAPCDLALLDVMMPDMDGLEVCRRLKGADVTRFIPVIIVTSLYQKEDRIAAIKAGADDFITKPVDKSELSARVKSLLRVKSLSDELEMKYREVLKLQELKDNFLHMIVHDFKNPLTGMVGYLDLLSGAMNSTCHEKCHRYVQNARNSTIKIKGMVQDLLDLCRLEEHRLHLKKEGVLLAQIVKDNIEELQKPILDNKLTVKMEGAEEMRVTVDKALFSRVVGNILQNAIRYSPREGEIVFRAEEGDSESVFSISDQGPGLPEEALERVFEKFYQVEAKDKGTRSGVGLGLAFCDLVCKAHGGGIKAANNTAGRGCTFTITLPVAPAA